MAPNSKHKIGALFLFFVWLTAATVRAEIPTDFDDDGTSDLTSVKANNLDLEWSSADLEGVNFVQTFGLVGDSIALAHWLGGGAPNLAIVRAKGKKLLWNCRTSDGSVLEKTFGKTGDTYLAGADFDGDGISDVATVRLDGKNLHWEIKTNFFDAAGPTVKVNFGTPGDRVFFASPDGQHDWIGSFGLYGKRRARLRVRDLSSRAVRTTTRIPMRFAKGQRPRPLPLRQADGSDLLVFSVTDESDTTFYTYDFNGALIDKVILAGMGNVAVGEFLSDAGEEIALQSSASVKIYNPRSGRVSNLVVPDTSQITAIDEVNIGTVALAATPTPVPTATPTATPQ